MRALLPAVLAAVAAWLAVRGPLSPRQVPPLVLVLPVVAALGLPAALLSGRRLVLALLLAGIAAAVAQHVVRARERAAAERRAEQVLLCCEGIAADLAAGQPPGRALERAAADWPELAPVAVAAELGADVPASLRRLAELPGAGQLTVVAAAWQVAHRSGSGLASAVGRAARSLGDERSTRRLVGGHLASARATARMLAVLPLIIMALGSGLGGDPVGFLVDTPLGLGCLTIGAALAHLGVLWLDRIAAKVLA